MDVFTSETCWALNKEIIKQMTSSWSLSTQLCVSVLSYKVYLCLWPDYLLVVGIKGWGGGLRLCKLLSVKTLWRHHEILSVRFRNLHTCWSYECVPDRVNVYEMSIMLAGRLRYAWQRPRRADSSYVNCYGAQLASNRVPAGSSMWSLSSEREISLSRYCE